jgi:hypothetical protein
LFIGLLVGATDASCFCIALSGEAVHRR